MYLPRAYSTTAVRDVKKLRTVKDNACYEVFHISTVESTQGRLSSLCLKYHVRINRIRMKICRRLIGNATRLKRERNSHRDVIRHKRDMMRIK